MNSNTVGFRGIRHCAITLQDGGVGSVTVDQVGIESFFSFRVANLASFQFNSSVKTTAITHMTACWRAVRSGREQDSQPEGILVVVNAHFDHALHQTTGRVFAPQHLSASAPIMCFAGQDRFFQCFAVHVAQHQDITRDGIGGHAGDQSIAIKFGGKIVTFFDLLYRGPLRGWSLAILGALEPKPSAAQHALGNRAVIDMLAYLGALVNERRRHPGDPDHDVLTRLIQGEVGGEQLSE